MKKSAKFAFCRGARLDRGFALLLVLVAVTLASLLALGMLAMSRLDRNSARGISNSDRTELLSQAALEHAVSLLDHNIPQPLPPGVDPIPLETSQPPLFSPLAPTQPTRPTFNNTNWVVNPGMLTLIGPGTVASSVQSIPLYTQPDPTDPNPTKVDLNAPLATTINSIPPVYPIRGVSVTSGTPPQCLVDWVNVLKDPTQPASKTNPIVGRYGFWIDDESAKVNINMAYGKPSTINLSNNNPLYAGTPYWDASEEFQTNDPLSGPHYQTNSSGNNTPILGSNASFAITVPTLDNYGNSVPTYYPLWHPAAINLDFLLQSAGDTNYNTDRNTLANWVHNVSGGDNNTPPNPIFNWRPLQDPEQIKSIIPNITSSIYEDLKFDITTKARSPEFNVFGKSRLYLESRAPLWDSDTFFQLNYDADGPEYFQSSETVGNYWTPNQTGIYSVVNSIVDKLTRTDWPGMPAGQSFETKLMAEGSGYSKTDADRELDQIAWNIAALGHYAADREPAHNVGYNNSYGLPTSSKQAYMPGSFWPEGQPLSWLLLNFSPPGAGNWGAVSGTPAADPTTVPPPRGVNSISQKQFNDWCQKGLLSGKAMLPWFPRPLINEIAVVVQLYSVINNPADPPNTGNYMLHKITSAADLAYARVTANAPGPAYTNNPGFYVGFSLDYELYEPPYMPPMPANMHIRPLHFEYHIQDNFGIGAATQIIDSFETGGTYYPNNPAITAPDAAAEGDAGGLSALDCYPYFTSTYPTMIPGNYLQVSAGNGGGYQYFIFAANGTSVNPAYSNAGGVNDAMPSPTWVFGSTFTGVKLTITNLKLKVVSFDQQNGGGYSPANVFQLIPIWDTHEIIPNTSNGPFTPPTTPQQYDLLTYANPAPSAHPPEPGYPTVPPITIDVDALAASGGTAYLSMEVDDARNGGNSNAWALHPDLVSQTPTSPINSPTQANSLVGTGHFPGTNTRTADIGTNAGTGPDSKYRFFDYGHMFYNSVDGRPSIGMLSIVPTGMQRDIPFDTFKFQQSTNPNQLPDWLMLDIVAPTIRPYSYMNSAMGKVNLNAQLYDGGGNGSAWQNDHRWRPLQAVFQNMEGSTTGTTTTASTVVNNIINHNLSGIAFNPAEAAGQYDYIGSLCEVAGVADSGSSDAWANEGLIRNVANLITTKSNTFTVWGIAESIQKSPTAIANFGVFTAGDQIQSTKRFTSTIERYVWPGKDGVPGNGAVNASGTYANVATGTDVNTIAIGPNPSWGPNYYQDNATAATSSYWGGLPKVGLLPWLPLPAPDFENTLEDQGPAAGGSVSGWGGPMALGATWPLLDGPDAPTFPNVLGMTTILPHATLRYDYGWRSYSRNTMTVNTTNSPGNPGALNGVMATGTQNNWGPDDPTSFWTQTTLENSNNPVRAWMKYRTVDFRYLDQ